MFSSLRTRLGCTAATQLSRVALPGPSQKSTTIVSRFFEQQQRFRWTKAKKKRTARFERREQLAREGKELPKPPYYFPKDTPVLHASPVEAREAEAEASDKQAALEMQKKVKTEPLLRFHMTGLQMSDRVRKLFDLQNGSQREVVKAQKQRAMELFQMRPGDTGSSAVQVIALTTRIQQMQMHFQKHKKDKHNKRGLDRMYVRRRKLLDYMERKEFDDYRRIVKTLGLGRQI